MKSAIALYAMFSYQWQKLSGLGLVEFISKIFGFVSILTDYI
jgi:hypothetical protein